MRHVETGRLKEPACVAVECRFGYSELAIDQVGPWLQMYRILRSETIQGGGLALSVLNLADAVNADVFEFIATLDGIVAEVREEERERRKNG